MKITISFTQEEKNTMMSVGMECSNVKEVVDKDEHLVGNFGEFKYDHIANEFTIDLKTAFVKASARLTMSIINMIKSFVGTCEMFSESWLSDIKDMTKEEQKEVVPDYTPVTEDLSKVME